MAKKIKDNAIDMEAKSPPSDRIFNKISMTCSIASLTMTLAVAIIFLIADEIGLNVWLHIFYPLLILSIAGLILGTNEILRNRYFSSILSVTLSSIVILCMILFTVLQIIVYKTVYILPFNYL